MEHDSPETPIGVLARRVRQVRTRREMTAEQLAARMRAVGVKWTRATVSKLETGLRQDLSITEWLALARALDVAPVHLLTQPESAGTTQAEATAPYLVTPVEVAPMNQVREWVRGLASLGATNPRVFFAETPAHEWGHHWVLVSKNMDEETRSAMLKWEQAGYAGYGQNDWWEGQSEAFWKSLGAK